MNQRCSCLAIARIQKVYPDYIPTLPIPLPSQIEPTAADVEKLKKDMKKMIHRAGHYKTWEKELGLQGGLALVLGNKYGETFWTKLVGKSGRDFKRVAQRLRQVKLPEEARKYANLENALVDHKVKILCGQVMEQW